MKEVIAMERPILEPKSILFHTDKGGRRGEV